MVLRFAYEFRRVLRKDVAEVPKEHSPLVIESLNEAEEQRLNFRLYATQTLGEFGGCKDRRPLIDGKSLAEFGYQLVEHLTRSKIRSPNFRAKRSGSIELAVWREPLGNRLDTFSQLFGSEPQLLPTISESVTTTIPNGGTGGSTQDAFEFILYSLQLLAKSAQ